jgi:hypothetical protein
MVTQVVTVQLIVGMSVVNIIVLMGVSHVKYVEKLGAFLSVAVSLPFDQYLFRVCLQCYP